MGRAATGGRPGVARALGAPGISLAGGKDRPGREAGSLLPTCGTRGPQSAKRPLDATP